MKKWLLLGIFVTIFQGFACDFIKGPDTLLERTINKIKSENKTGDIICDVDNLKMAYYLVENEEYNLNLGVFVNIDETTTNEQFKNGFLKKFNDYRVFFQTLNRKNLGDLPLPDRDILRFYGKIKGTDQVFIIGKYEYDRKLNKYTMFANSSGKELFDKIGLFTGITIEYRQLDREAVF